MVSVDLVYDVACPNVKAARGNLMRAFSRAGMTAHWQEYQIGSPDAPARVRGFGSPTILVNGLDVAGVGPDAEDCCRVYETGGAPGVELVKNALLRANQSEAVAVVERGRWRSTVAVLPAIGVAFMPKFVCPFCWPVYAGLLSAAGLAFLLEDRWLFPISVGFLAAALVALGWKARSRRGLGPLVVGAVSSIAIVTGKFALDLDALVYFGIATLMAACAWNAWPRRGAEGRCAACVVPEAPKTMQPEENRT